MLTPAQRSVISGGPPGRPRAGLIAGVAAGLGCALIVLGIDMVESVDSARHSVVPFLVALPLALLPVPLLIALVLLVDQLEPEPILGLIRRYLPAYQDSGLATEADLRMLSTLRERREARRWARATGGRPLARAMKAYQLAATELALAHERLQRGGATPGEFEDRRRALTGVLASAHGVNWGQGHRVAGPARHARPGGR
jgi:hypothetical protein